MAPKLLITFAIVVLLAASVLADDPSQELKGVLDLRPETFDDVVNGRKDVLVEFYAPWCGHCKRLTPVFQQLGERVQNSPSLRNRVVIAKVNAEEHRSLGNRFGIRGFPTLKYFGRGKPVDEPADYQGGRSMTEILAYINKSLEADAGFARVEVMDALALRFRTEDPAAVLEEARAQAAALAGDDAAHAPMYIKFMEKAIAKGGGALEHELVRLKTLVDGGKASGAKLDEMSRKMSVLTAFVENNSENTVASE